LRQFLTLAAAFAATFLAGDSAAAPPAAPVAASPAGKACTWAASAYDKALKDMADVKAESIGYDDSAPRATMRAAQLEAYASIANASIAYGAAHRCPGPALPPDPSVYLEAAAGCRLAIMQSARAGANDTSYKAKCARDSWTPGVEWGGTAP
jgi:hypothetical protein